MLTLQTLTERFLGLGFKVHPNTYGQSEGLMVATPPQMVSLIGGGNVLVSEAWVDLYPRHGTWIVRVTPHGGPHWIRGATSMEEVETFAREVLDVGLGRWTPSDGWFETPGGDLQ